MATTSPQARYARRNARPRYDEPADASIYDTLDVPDEDEAPPQPVDPAELARHYVTAVLVAHEGRRWLPDVLSALDSLERSPDLITAVDTGSKDNTRWLLTDALGDGAVLRASRMTGFGGAVNRALAAADARRPAAQAEREHVEWVWLLHDDSAPEPTTLTRLLECAVRNPDAAVIGPKVRGWAGSRQLLEVGLTITSGGRRYTGLERREFDQGQQDETRNVLAVGSAGMLVRRDVWDSLGGFDPQLTLFRDDVDFGWRANLAGHRVVVCPDAVMHHAEASAHGRRRISTTRHPPHFVDRRNALHVVLVNCSLRRLPLSVLQVTLGSVLRALGLLIGKLPMTAIEELAALGAVLVRPDRLVRGRLARRELRRRPPEELRPLFPPGGHQLRHASDTLLSVLSGTGTGQDLTVAKRRAAGGDAEDKDHEPVAEHHLRALIRRPSAALLLALLIVGVLAERSLLLGGRLMGGALLPAQNNVGELWDTYTASWHAVGLGSQSAAPPYLAVLALLGVLPAGQVSVVVNLLMLLSVPLAGLTAYVALRHLVTNPWLGVWGAAIYGLLPATTGAIAAGRLGTCVAIVTTPLLCVVVHRMLARPTSPLRIAWLAALLLAITAAFVPLAWVAALALSAVVVGVGVRDRDSLIRLAILLLVPPLLWIPWTFKVVRAPLVLFTEAGAPGPGLSDPRLPAWVVALAHPGGPSSAPAWLFAGLLLAGVTGLLRTETRRIALIGATVAVTGLVLGLVVSRIPITGPTLDAAVAGWPGYAAVLIVLGLIIAAVVTAQNVYRRLATAGFSRQQPAALAAAVLALMIPVVAAVWWVWRGADVPLTRREPSILPAYVVAQNMSSAHPRTLVISRGDAGLMTYALLRDAGPRLGDAETGPGQDVSRVTDEVVADLVSGRETDVTALTDLAVAHVYLPAPADNAMITTLDSVSGLSRASAPEGAAMWKVNADVSRLRIVNPDGTSVAVPSESVDARAPLPEGPEGRELVLAEAADSGWEATLMGRPLDPKTVDGWAQGFALPSEGGPLELSHRSDARTRWLWLQAAFAAVLVILAMPTARRRVVDADEELDHETVAAQPVFEPAPPETSESRPRRGRRRKSAPPLPLRSRRPGGRVNAQEWLGVSEAEVLGPPPIPAGSAPEPEGVDPAQPEDLDLRPQPEVDDQETAVLGPPPVVVPLGEGQTYKPRRAGRRIDEETNR